MSEELAVEHTGEQRDPAFEILEIDRETGVCVVAIKKGILGSSANQLKNTNDRRKGASILRKLGFELAKAGDILYGKDPDGTGLENVVNLED